MNMKRYLFLAVFLFAFALTCSAQTLAERARQERERQRTVQSRITIVGGATVPSPAQAPAATSQPAAQQNAKPVEPLDDKGRNEKYWRTAFQQARDNAKRAADKVQLADLKVKDLNTRLQRQSDLYNREYLLAPEITAAQKELEDARKESVQAAQKVADLEDELRKSG